MPIKILPPEVTSKIAAGEVIERPASVVKELIENSLDAGATEISIEAHNGGVSYLRVTDNGCGLSAADAEIAIRRHATSKITGLDDLEHIHTLGFRGEALASIASVSRFVLTTRRKRDESASRIQIDGGALRDVSQTGAPVGTRVAVNRLYFNTPVRAKFLKGVATELGHCLDVVQRHALAREGVAFQFSHNDRLLLDIPEHASLRERIALIWGLGFVRDMAELKGDQGGYRVRGLIGLPGLTRSARSHQLYFVNRRPVSSYSLQAGFEEGYRGLVTVGRRPVGVILLEMHPRFVDVNIHPAKREIRFRDDRAVRDMLSGLVREALAALQPKPAAPVYIPPARFEERGMREETGAEPWNTAPSPDLLEEIAETVLPSSGEYVPEVDFPLPEANAPVVEPPAVPAQPELPGFSAAMPPEGPEGLLEAAYQPVGILPESPLQLFDTYLLVPAEDRLLIIDQHALHERLNFDNLLKELRETGYESQQLAVPLVLDVAPSQVRLMETSRDFFESLGITVEPFGGSTFQISAICHLYDEGKVRDVVYHILDGLGQGDLFDRTDVMEDMLRMAVRACKASVRAGDRLTPAERQRLLEGFRRLRPPYTCPHGRPIIVEITQRQMEKSFRRIQ